MSQFSRFLDSHFSANGLNEIHKFIQGLKAIHPSSQHVPMVERQFSLIEYLNHKGIKPETVTEDTISLYISPQGGPAAENVTKELVRGVFKFTYEGIDFILYKIETGLSGGAHPSMFYDFVFDPPADIQPPDSPAKNLILDVAKWISVGKEDAIWVFEGGSWTQDVELSLAIKSSRWDNLVLEESFIEGLKRDTDTFFASEKIYKVLGITWKRGILLIGPPGNGKTETIKALLNDTTQTALFVKSFSSMGGTEYGIRAIFEHARKQAPCILILEDLDAMVTPNTISFFLNELDGLAQNEGVLTIATTNHPERIDDAILNRPSRFDVKYMFSLPALELRKQFAIKWIKKLRAFESDPDIGRVFERDDDAAIATDVAQQTNEWSFAFLKELFVSFLLRFAHVKSLRKDELKPREIEQLFFDQIEQLGLQILKTKDLDTPEFSIGRKFPLPRPTPLLPPPADY